MSNIWWIAVWRSYTNVSKYFAYIQKKATPIGKKKIKVNAQLLLEIEEWMKEKNRLLEKSLEGFDNPEITSENNIV